MPSKLSQLASTRLKYVEDFAMLANAPFTKFATWADTTPVPWPWKVMAARSVCTRSSAETPAPFAVCSRSTASRVADIVTPRRASRAANSVRARPRRQANELRGNPNSVAASV